MRINKKLLVVVIIGVSFIIGIQANPKNCQPWKTDDVRKGIAILLVTEKGGKNYFGGFGGVSEDCVLSLNGGHPFKKQLNDHKDSFKTVKITIAKVGGTEIKLDKQKHKVFYLNTGKTPAKLKRLFPEESDEYFLISDFH